MNFADYLDSISPEERSAFAEGPTAVVPPVTPSYTTTPVQMTYSVPAVVHTVAPLVTAPVPAGEWRRAVSVETLALANAVNVLLRSAPTSPVRNLLTPLRTFGLVVLDPTRMTLAAARSTIIGLVGIVSTSAAFRAVGAWEARAGLARILALMPASDAPTTPTTTPDPWVPSDWTPPGGGTGPASPGTSPGATPPGPTTSGCPANASPVDGGCGCNPGFMPDRTMTSCVPITSADPTTPTPGGATAGSSSSGMGWLFLLGGAALMYKALGK